MTIQQQELGVRVKKARLARGLSQEEMSQFLQISRSAVSQIESGKRTISSLELDKLSGFFGISIADFLAEKFEEVDPLIVLFRAEASMVQSDEFIQILHKALNIAREVSNLENLLNIRQNNPNIIYQYPVPRSKWEAIQQGCQLADEERHRLNLGISPINQIHQLIESQGIKIDLLTLPDDISGLTLYNAKTGPFIAINASQVLYRRHFSFAHEYAHVLVDRNGLGMISHSHIDEKNLIEVRANAFAASFLMPEEGVRSFILNLGKGEKSRVYSEGADTLIEGRSHKDNQEIQIYDVAQLAHHFGVSRQASINRLRGLKLISEGEFDQLKRLEQQGFGRQAAILLSLEEQKTDKTTQELHNRLIALALEAYRRDLITRMKLKELSALSSMPLKYLDSLVNEIDAERS